MDLAGRRPQLPALEFLDDDKHHYHRDSHSSAIATSPASQYPCGPPPPYSHHGTPAQHHDANSGVRTPPDSRRTSGEDKETVRQTIRQSLPSISEALGVDSQTPYSNAPPPPVAAPAANYQPPTQAGAAAPTVASPSSSHPRSHGGMDAASSSSSSTYQQHSAAYTPRAAYPPQPYAPAEPRKPVYDPAHDAAPPSLHPIKTTSSPLRTIPPPPPPPPPPPSSASYQYAPASTSPKYEDSPSQSATSGAPSSSFTYGYTPYPSRYGQSTPPSSATSAPIYQPSISHAAPPTPTWKSEQPRFVDDRMAFQHQHNDSVKRHLDFYDLEAALNEIAKTSDTLSSFSKRYSDQMHQSARAGPSLSSLPSVPEVDDLILKTRLQADALAKVRDVVLAQHTAYEQQVAEQSQQRKAFAAKSMPPPDPPQDSADLKTIGFAGGEAKKRRGRAAPPGRCHSCNRAETPEWRRGPDGARTLCNACGLHYAKVTRKMNQQNKQAVGAGGSSNLRPKEA
ncbi:hypothetical protein K431DRAFT_303058 [Polychaeton citri CBS 116435]|uniref:GATA-type domain-containing protein n=1 Tax=Polychaeton citri CBS 116435 TaxID=1314669 RepID=A0A9P4QBX6_9PEZI|nr:hypothetical protein K431DRAFT_303058 [Polychaeton citri CBS 116435]